MAISSRTYLGSMEGEWVECLARVDGGRSDEDGGGASERPAEQRDEPERPQEQPQAPELPDPVEVGEDG